VEKIWYSQTGHRWQYNTAHALCVLDNYGYRHTLRMCNTYCFSTATVVTRTHQVLCYTYSACVVITDTVFCAVRTEFVYIKQVNLTATRISEALKNVSSLFVYKTEYFSCECQQSCLSCQCHPHLQRTPLDTQPVPVTSRYVLLLSARSVQSRHITFAD
jgi:hypothetical protein